MAPYQHTYESAPTNQRKKDRLSAFLANFGETGRVLKHCLPWQSDSRTPHQALHQRDAANRASALPGLISVGGHTSTISLFDILMFCRYKPPARVNQTAPADAGAPVL